MNNVETFHRSYRPSDFSNVDSISISFLASIIDNLQLANNLRILSDKRPVPFLQIWNLKRKKSRTNRYQILTLKSNHFHWYLNMGQSTYTLSALIAHCHSEKPSLTFKWKATLVINLIENSQKFPFITVKANLRKNTTFSLLSHYNN